MAKPLVALGILVLLATTTLLQADYLRHRPTVLKLGPAHDAQLVRICSGEFSGLAAMRSVVQVIFYFGSFFEEQANRIQGAPEYYSMFAHLQNAVQLDHYNRDAYYFAQGSFTWELGRIKEVNNLLDYGMRYRTWDPQLPFYAGFNAAYFLKDYEAASRYMQTAAEVSGSPLYTTLASRYFHESGESALGITFLKTMISGAESEQVRQIYQRRLDALRHVQAIEVAVAEYRLRYTAPPDSLASLIDKGLLKGLPRDPYGGKFYLDEQGRVRSTSKFSLNVDTEDVREETDDGN